MKEKVTFCVFVNALYLGGSDISVHMCRTIPNYELYVYVLVSN